MFNGLIVRRKMRKIAVFNKLDAKFSSFAILSGQVPNDPTCDLARHRAYETAFHAWFSALPTCEQQRLQSAGIDKPLSIDRTERERFQDRTELPRPEPSYCPDPVEAMEGTPEDTRAVADAFGQALAWCLRASSIVEVGQRYLAVLHIWRPSLIVGIALEIDQGTKDDIRDQVGGNGPGAAVGPALEWGRRGSSLAQIGQRVLTMAYVLNPALISGKTLAAIGATLNKTRQAIDKLVQDFRDTFRGIRSRNMRPEENRLVCRNAQLSRA